MGEAVTDSEGPARRLAVGKHGVAMAHQNDVAAEIGLAAGARLVAAGRDTCPQAIAVLRLSDGFNRDAVSGKEPTQCLADRIDAGLVVAAAVDLDDLAQQRDHGILLRGQPRSDPGFG